MRETDAAFSRVFIEWFPRVTRYLDCLTGERSLAEDVAQETFLKLYRRSLDGFDGDGLRLWLFRVAKNQALNKLRRRKTRSLLSEKVKELTPGAVRDPEALLQTKQRLSRLTDLLDALSTDQRSAILLREQEGMSYREVSEVLQVSESKVKIDIFRGRQALRARREGRSPSSPTRLKRG